MNIANEEVEVTRSFPSKSKALGFMMALSAKQILLVETDTDFKVVYAALRSITVGEVVINRDEEIPTTT